MHVACSVEERTTGWRKEGTRDKAPDRLQHMWEPKCGSAWAHGGSGSGEGEAAAGRATELR